MIPVGYILVGAFTGFLFLVGMFWGGLVWLRNMIRAEFTSEDFEKRVTQIVNGALERHVEKSLENMSDRLNDIAKRQDSQAASISEAHRRVDRVMEVQATPPPSRH